MIAWMRHAVRVALLVINPKWRLGEVPLRQGIKELWDAFVIRDHLRAMYRYLGPVMFVAGVASLIASF